MPRRRPPVDIFTFPLPDRFNSRSATCPQCGAAGHPIGIVGARIVYQCEACKVRFKNGSESRMYST